MITIMALAHRTAEAIAEDAGAKAADLGGRSDTRLTTTSMRGARLGY